MNEETMTAVPEAGPTRHPGLGFRGLVKVFTSPSELFSKVKEDPKIFVPYVAMGVLALLLMIVLLPYIMELQMQSEQFRQAMEQQGGSATVRQQAEAVMKFTVPVFGTAAMLVLPLLIAALAMFWGNFVFAGQASFKAILSVTLFGEFLYLVGGWATVPMILAKDSMLVTYSLAALMPNPDPTSFLWTLLSKVSVFHIWELVVLGIGYSIVYQLPRNKGIWIAVLSMGLLSILHAVITGLGGLFA